MPLRSLILAALLLAWLPSAAAHTVRTKAGKVYEGAIVSRSDTEIVIDTTFDGQKVIPTAEIAAVDDAVPPLREQLAYRAGLAEDVAARWDLYTWAHDKGFKKELTFILEAIIDVAPDDRRARKLLGHKKVGSTWMTPEEEKRHLEQAFEAEQRAKGLVPYKGEWVTPKERDAREQGLLKDGDDWVTEEEFHRRRGEQMIGGKWVKLGHAEGKALTERIVAEARIPISYHWGPHFDAHAEVSPELGQRIVEACESAYAVMRRTLRPTPDEYPEVLEERIHLFLNKKIPGFVRFAAWFDKTYDVESLTPGWKTAIQRQHAWWHVQDIRGVGVYQFPNTDKTFVSNVVHNAGLVLLTRYKANYAFPSVWLLEGFSYYLELEALGYTQSFTLGQGGGTGGEGTGMAGPLWADSAKWRPALRDLVGQGQDPPLRRIAKMTLDQFRYVELVKSWSVVEFLVRWDAARFKTFIGLSKDRSKTEEEALQAAYGVDYRALDEKWRAYVTADFKVP
ncbi:MAG: hypothetical protein O2894_13205 [Planctomycetota bacterium]|nr:hypothetical protein [Planctomycetota bacterium]